MPRSLRTRTLTAALVAAVAMATASSSAGAAGFLADETLASATTDVPALAMAPNGFAVVAWFERPAADSVVRVSVRPPGGAWSAPQTLDVRLPSASVLDVAIASSGAAAISWQEVTPPSTFQVAVATRAAGGSFGAPELLTDGTQTLSPAVGIDAAGTVTLLYAPTPNTVVREFAAGTSVLAASPHVLSPCATFGQRLAVSPMGDAVAGYRCSGAVFALRRGGRWAVSPPVPDSFPGGACPSSTSHDPASVAIDGAGNPVGVLQRTLTQRFDLGLGGCQTLATTVDVSLVLPLAGFMTTAPGPPAVSGTSVGPFGFPIFGPTAAISPAGIVLAWGDSIDPLRGAAKVRFHELDGSGAGAAQTVGSTPSAGAVVPALALAADGRGLLAWAHVDRPGGDAVVVAAERAPGGSFGEPVPISEAGAPSTSPTVAIADTGDGAVAWTRNAMSPYELHLRGYDASAPTLSGVAIPPTATAGVPASFAASAFDLWGPSTVRWDFGDGATATGAAVQHAYARAGTYTATVTATDAVGLGASQSGLVRVVEAAPVPPPRITGASARPSAFRVGRAPTAVSAARRRRARRRPPRAPVGTTFRFALDRAATVTIAFERTASGLRAGRGRAARCARPSRRLRRARARRCRRWVPAGGRGLTRAGRAGANAVAFSGRVGRRALRPGTYRARLTPAADGRAGQAASVSFRVVR